MPPSVVASKGKPGKGGKPTAGKMNIGGKGNRKGWQRVLRFWDKIPRSEATFDFLEDEEGVSLPFGIASWHSRPTIKFQIAYVGLSM